MQSMIGFAREINYRVSVNEKRVWDGGNGFFIVV